MGEALKPRSECPRIVHRQVARKLLNLQRTAGSTPPEAPRIFYAIRRISGTIVVVMVLHALWDFGSFSHVAGKAGAVAAKIDIATAGAGLLQSLLVLIAVIVVIVGAKKILRPKTTTQARAVQA